MVYIRGKVIEMLFAKIQYSLHMKNESWCIFFQKTIEVRSTSLTQLK